MSYKENRFRRFTAKVCKRSEESDCWGRRSKGEDRLLE